ncbi:MAG: hypothetical protein JXB32_11705 [Deltaproteobacteria bacterium]|nr:hypothetical protein [Deltaproteobacteria bacterium]
MDEVTIRLESRDGVLSTRIDDEGTTPIRELMAACLESHRAALAAATSDGDAFRFRLTVTFDHWCEHPPAVAGAVDPTRGVLHVGGGKDTRRLTLVPAPFGYWLLTCDRADALRVAVDDRGNVQVGTSGGAYRASLERSATGFRLFDAEGRVVLRGERQEGEYRLLDGADEVVGRLGSGDRAACPGANDLAAVLKIPAGETGVCCRERRCWCSDGPAHGWDVSTDAGCVSSSFAAAAVVFSAGDLPLEQQAALGAFLLSEDLP